MAGGCTVEGTAQHEVMHTLGFKHEHQHPLRDAYIHVENPTSDQYKKRRF